MAEEEKWEYTSAFVFANVENEGAKEYIENRWPKWTDVRKFSPATIIPFLDSYGSDGWELVHMEPVLTDENDAVVLFGNTQSTTRYFCVFKRRKSD